VSEGDWSSQGENTDGPCGNWREESLSFVGKKRFTSRATGEGRERGKGNGPESFRQKGTKHRGETHNRVKQNEGEFHVALLNFGKRRRGRVQREAGVCTIFPLGESKKRKTKRRKKTTPRVKSSGIPRLIWLREKTIFSQGGGRGGGG